MADKVTTKRSGPEEKTEDKNLSQFIVVPEQDPISEEYKDGDLTKDLDSDPVAFREDEGKPTTPAEATINKKKGKAKVAVIQEVVKVEKKTKVEEAEQYKKILISLGFDLQEAREEGKIQYAIEHGELRIGRTFTEGSPTGRFWAIKDGNFLDPPDVKELSIIKEFYAVRDGKKDIKDVVLKTVPRITVPLTPEQKIGEDVVPYKKEVPQQINRKIGTMKLQKKGGYYQVAGHKEPDAWLVQQWGTEAGVTLTIKFAEQDDESAKAVVRAQLGVTFVEAAVIHYFKTTQDVITLETIDIMERRHKKPIVGIDQDGHPLLSTDTLYEIYKRLIRFKNFSVRDAITKASRIATLKILNQDWREPEEIEAEASEVRSVNADQGR